MFVLGRIRSMRGALDPTQSSSPSSSHASMRSVCWRPAVIQLRRGVLLAQSGSMSVGTSANWRDADARRIRLNRSFQQLMDEQVQRATRSVACCMATRCTLHGNALHVAWQHGTDNRSCSLDRPHAARMR
jgi:hypothetical protein